jgi:hypothetical protein
LFRAATARQIGREYAGLDPGPGFDVSPESVPMPAVRVGEINWSTTPVETIPLEGGNLRASLIAYRELALAGIHGRHELQQRHDRLVDQNHRLHDELRALRLTGASLSAVDSEQPAPSHRPSRSEQSRHYPETDSEQPAPSLSLNESEKQARFPLSGVSGVRGVQGLRGVR